MLRAALLAVLVSAASPDTRAAGETGIYQDGRPKIGLALSGGGARGAAHIGVLRVLEQLRVPVDYIAGTSMGSIIGGLYASGMSPDEIEEAFTSIDWENIFSDEPSRETRTFRRKRDDDLYINKARVGYNDGQVGLPTGLIQGQKFDLELRRLTLHVSRIRDFDRLPIPFRAVATDIDTGKAVVLDQGDLALALRASMAVPGVFAAVTIDDLTLVDGGIADNLPIDVVREMGADIIIAVNTSTPLDSTARLDNLLKITGRLVSFLTTRNVEAQIANLGEEDVLLVPDLGKVTSSDFDKTSELIPAGEVEALAQQARLRQLGMPEVQYSAYRTAHRATALAGGIVEFVDIENDSGVSDSVIREHISQQVGESLDLDRLEQDIGSIYGLEIFDTVNYEVVQRDGRTGIEVTARKRRWGPNYLQLGLALSGDWRGVNNFNFGLAYLKTAINSLNGELRFTGQIGSDIGASVDWYQPLDASARYFVEPVLFYRKRNVAIYQSGGVTRIAEYRVADLGVDLAGGINIGDYGEARLGIRRSRGDADLYTGTPGLPTGRFDSGSVYARFWVDRLNQAYFPTSGYTAKVQYSAYREGLGNDDDLDQLELAGTRFLSFGRHTLGFSANYNTTLDGDAAIQDRFISGGFLNLSGYAEDSLNGPHSALLSMVFYRRFELIKFLPWYIGASLEYGNVWEDRDDMSFDSAILAGSLFLGADTPLGPLYLGYGHAEHGRRAGFFYLGKTF